MSEPEPIRAAVIGYGLSARVFHLPFLDMLPEFEIAGISTSQPAAADDWPGVPLYAGGESLIDESDAELVVITAPNHAHYALACRALEAGKHVLVEKPFVTTVDEGEELVALAAEKNLTLAVYHNRRFDGDFLTVARLIAEGRLGAVRVFESHFDRFRPNVRDTWRESAGEGSGILYDLGPHLIDQAVQLFGVPDAVTATVRASRPGAVTDDLFHIQLHYPGVLAILHSSPYAAAPNLRFKVEGDTATFLKYGLDPQEPRLKEGISPAHPAWADEAPDDYGWLYDGHGSHRVRTERGCYYRYFEGLAAAVRMGVRPPATGEQALVVMRLIDLAFESSRQGRTLSVS
ncbi:MAG: oxidoreductase [Alphaproteobacteria bacterium]|nr:MAG: oxidoreductase [Alphaproteobacteria bacterium]